MSLCTLYLLAELDSLVPPQADAAWPYVVPANIFSVVSLSLALHTFVALSGVSLEVGSPHGWNWHGSSCHHLVGCEMCLTVSLSVVCH